MDEDNETAEVQWLDRFGVDTAEVPLESCVEIEFQEHEVGTRVQVTEASQENAKGSKGTVEETFSAAWASWPVLPVPRINRATAH